MGYTPLCIDEFEMPPRCEDDMELKQITNVSPGEDFMDIETAMMVCHWCGLFAQVGVVKV